MRRFVWILLTALLILGLSGCMDALPPQGSLGDLPIVILQDTDSAEMESQSQSESETAVCSTQAQLSETEGRLETEAASPASSLPTEPAVTEDGVYSSKEEVALYIHCFGHLPSNYITKKEAEALGWPGGALEPYAPGKCIGGGRFGNYEGLLPSAAGRSWTECDIDTLGAKARGAKRIVFSNDGLIYYTEDHYEHFELLYGEEG